MHKRPSLELKEKILLAIKAKAMTYAQLERKINTGFRTIKSNCEELNLYGMVSIKVIKEHPANGRPSYEISITERGIETLNKK